MVDTNVASYPLFHLSLPVLQVYSQSLARLTHYLLGSVLYVEASEGDSTPGGEMIAAPKDFQRGLSSRRSATHVRWVMTTVGGIERGR